MMEGERYRLEALLTLRKAAEEEARRTLAEAEAALCQAEAEALEAGREVERREAQARRAKDRAAHPGKVAEMAAARQFAARCVEEVREARQGLELARARATDARTAAETARQGLAERAREREALERHREEWLAERRKESDRRADNLLDELAGAAHARNEER
jgi:dTMP kinase